MTMKVGGAWQIWTVNSSWCFAGTLFAVCVRLGELFEFEAWAYPVQVPGGEQLVSWSDFLICGAVFWLPSVVLLGLERKWPGGISGSPIISMQRMNTAIIAATIIGGVVYLVIRPDNFPISTIILAGFFSVLLISSHQIFKLIQSGQMSDEAERHPAQVKLFLLIAGCLVSILLLEGLLRFHNPIEYSVRGNDVVLPTNKRVIVVNENPVPGKTDAEVNISRNKLGLRGPEAPINFDEHLTLVTIGGSTTAGRNLTNGKTWTDQMALLLAPNFKNLWVNNGGLVGHSTYGHIRLISGFLSNLKPNVAIFLTGINDLGRDQGLKSVKEHDLLIEPSHNRIRPILESLADWSELASVLHNGERALRAWRLGFSRTQVGHLHTTVSEEPLLPNQQDFKQAVAAQALRFQPAYRDRINKIINLTREAGIQPIFVTQPFLWGEGVDPMTGINLATRKETLFGMQISSLTYWETLEQYNQTLREVAAAANVPLVDLALKMPKNSALFLDRMHFGNNGAAYVGRIVSEGICVWLKHAFPQFAKKPSGTCNLATE